MVFTAFKGLLEFLSIHLTKSHPLKRSELDEKVRLEIKSVSVSKSLDISVEKVGRRL